MTNHYQTNSHQEAGQQSRPSSGSFLRTYQLRLMRERNEFSHRLLVFGDDYLLPFFHEYQEFLQLG